MNPTGPIKAQQGGPWPPPAAVRPTLRRVRAALHQLPRVEWPALHHPPSALVLFYLPELVRLARFGLWPLPPRYLRWLRLPPGEASSRQRRVRRRVEMIARDLLVTEGPELIEAVVADLDAAGVRS